MYTQDMEGNRSFPEKPSPASKPGLRTISPKVTPSGNQSAGMSGYGEQGDGIEINAEAPAGNKRLLNGGKFVQQQFHKGTELDHVTPAETSIRNVRLADLGPEFGRASLNEPLEIAGEKRS